MSDVITFMIPQLVFLPKVVSTLALVVLLFAAYQERQQGHIGRLAIFGNAFFLWQIFFSSWTMLPDFFAWYLNLGTILGLVALGMYLAKESLPTEFYDFCYYAYGSLTVVLIIIVAVGYGVLPI